MEIKKPGDFRRPRRLENGRVHPFTPVEWSYHDDGHVQRMGCTAWTVLTFMMRCADSRDDVEMPSVITTAKSCGLSEQGARNAIKRLLKFEYIGLKHEGGGRGRKTIYTIMALTTVPRSPETPNDVGCLVDPETPQYVGGLPNVVGGLVDPETPQYVGGLPNVVGGFPHHVEGLATPPLYTPPVIPEKTSTETAEQSVVVGAARKHPESPTPTLLAGTKLDDVGMASEEIDDRAIAMLEAEGFMHQEAIELVSAAACHPPRVAGQVIVDVIESANLQRNVENRRGFIVDGCRGGWHPSSAVMAARRKASHDNSIPAEERRRIVEADAAAIAQRRRSERAAVREAERKEIAMLDELPEQQREELREVAISRMNSFVAKAVGRATYQQSSTLRAAMIKTMNDLVAA